jgi:hypothetical protein
MIQFLITQKSMQGMKNVTIRVSEEIIERAESAYGAKVTGLQIAADAYFELLRRTQQELKGIFTKAEIFALVDNQNGVELSTQFGCDGKLLWWHLQDGDTYDGLFQKWGCDPDQFEQKVMGLTSAQAWFLQDQIRRFWQQDGERDLEGFAKSFQL